MRLSAGSCGTGSERAAILRNSVKVSYQLQGPDGLVGDVGVQLNSGRLVRISVESLTVVFCFFFFSRFSPGKFQHIASDCSLSF